MNYLTKDDWNNTFLQKISDDNSFIKYFKSMAKIHNNLLYIFQKLTHQKNNNLSLKEKVSLNNSQQKVFTTSLFFYHKYNLKEDLLSKELSPSEQCLIYAACIFLGLKVFHLPKNVNGLATIIQPYILSSEKKLEISEIKELIFQKEFDILLSIGFDINVDLPYQFIYTFKTYLQKLNYTNSRIDGLVKLLLIYINDSIIFPIYLYYPPNVIALSCIFLIKEKHKIDEINIDDLIKLSNYYIDIDSIKECTLLIKKIILTKDNLAKVKAVNKQIKNENNVNDAKSKNIITNFISSIKSNRD